MILNSLKVDHENVVKRFFSCLTEKFIGCDVLQNLPDFWVKHGTGGKDPTVLVY